MCPCYKQEFQAAGHTYIKKLIHFHCKFKEKHFHYVLFCENHPFGFDFSSSVRNEIKNFGGLVGDEKCTCKNGFSHEVCNFCFPARYLSKFKCFKIRVEEVPDEFIERVVSLNHYFKKIKCEPFFFHSVKTKMIEIGLDNPCKKVLVTTDYKLI